MYLYSTFNFWSLDIHDIPGGGGKISITNAGRIRLPSPIVQDHRVPSINLKKIWLCIDFDASNLKQAVGIQNTATKYIGVKSNLNHKDTRVANVVRDPNTLSIVIDGTPASTFCFEGNLTENHLSYMNKWYLIF